MRFNEWNTIHCWQCHPGTHHPLAYHPGVQRSQNGTWGTRYRCVSRKRVQQQPCGAGLGAGGRAIRSTRGSGQASAHHVLRNQPTPLPSYPLPSPPLPPCFKAHLPSSASSSALFPARLGPSTKHCTVRRNGGEGFFLAVSLRRRERERAEAAACAG